MALFDTKTFFYNAGRGENPVTALGSAFGMPSCLIGIAQDLLSLLPSKILDPIRKATQDGITAADDSIKSALASLGFLNGIIEYDTEVGRFRLILDSSRNGLDQRGSDVLNTVGGFLGVLSQAASYAGRIYTVIESVQQQIDEISDCIQSYSDYLNYTGGANANQLTILEQQRPDEFQKLLLLRKFDIVRSDINEATEFKKAATDQLRIIDSILASRIENPNLEPVFKAVFSSTLEGTNLPIELPPIPEKVEEIIRLKFGPPISIIGKFILSIDGLYYDSQTSGLIPVLTEIENRKSNLQNNFLWKLDFDSSLGGRGTQVTLDNLNIYIDTILDPKIVNESNFIREYYDKDETLGEIIGQMNRRVFDLSSQIVDLKNSSAAEIVISNMKQVILSESSHHQQKINKRKKQIELAVLMPSIYRNEIIYNPGDEIPVNDFSYLQGINYKLDIEKQKNLVLSQNEVSGVVLPLTVRYVQQIDQPEKIILNHLLINNIGIGSIVADGSGLMAPQLTITNSIETSNLIALYNLLKFEIDDTSSTNFRLNNSSDLSTRMNAQLVGPKENSIFRNGVGIVRLDGVTKHSSTQPTVPSSVGSYIRLPEQREFQNLLFNDQGATFEAWVHAPNLNSDVSGYGCNNASGLYRLILANENTGLRAGGTQQSDILTLANDNSADICRGVIFGFTRDRRFTLNQTGSNISSDNPTSAACIVFAPTQSFNSSSIGFINKSYDLEDGCSNFKNLWYGMTFPLSSKVDGIQLSSCNDEFCQLTLTMNPIKNQIKLYCDGQLLTTSSYLQVFGTDPTKSYLNIPSIKLNNSFEYNSNFMSSVNVPELKTGPKLDQYFTPWILGGGYTDGMQTGNFMGGQYGGMISGLKGYMGGIKFYSKALTNSEVLKNYNASKIFFKNIDTNSFNNN